MRAYIHAFQGRPWNEDCQAAYDGFTSLGIECRLFHKIQFYHGDTHAVYDRSVIEAAVDAYSNIPAGCSLDFGVTEDGRTLLIEMNDGMALGCYGLPTEQYAKLLSARWAELTGTKDIWEIRRGCVENFIRRESEL